MKALKTVCSIILLVGSILSSHNQTKALDVNSYVLSSTEAKSRIWLKGSLSTPLKRSVSQPISVIQEENVLNIYYLCDLGKIEVTISNAQGSAIYNEMVTVPEQANTSINLDKFKKGNYTLTFKNDEGKELYGTFSME